MAIHGTWTIDASHSSVHFIVRHMVITKVRGAFKSFSGEIDIDEADLGRSKVEVTIDATSIDTSEARRDAHLQSADFFDAERFPTLTFKSSKVARNGDEYKVTGALTIHGVTREVVLDAEFEGGATDPWGGQRIAFGAKTSIMREDYGLTWNQLLEAGGTLVSSKVDIELEIQAVKAAAKAS